MKHRKEFERTLRRAARLSLITGKISLREWSNVQSVLWNQIRTTPDGVELDLLDEVAEDCLCLAKEQDKLSGVTAVEGQKLTDIEGLNWDGLLAFLKEFMPIILTFIQTLLAIFGKTTEEPPTT